MAFASVSDLATHLKTALSAEDTATGTQALDMATALIKVYTGQEIEAVDGRIESFRARNTVTLKLGQIPVRAVDGITVDTVAFTDFDVDLPSGLITRNDYYGCTAWSTFEKIQVTYDSGYTTIPLAVKYICLDLASRLMVSPPGWERENVGNYGRAAESGSAGGFTKAERTILHRLRG